MSFVLGLNHKLYIQTTGGPRVSWPGAGYPPGLVEVGTARDVELDGEGATADVTTRSGGGNRQLVATLNDLKLDFSALKDESLAVMQFIKTAWRQKTIFGVAVLDGDRATNGSQGFWLDGVVVGYDDNQELEEASILDLSIQSSNTDVPPEIVTVGNPGFGWTYNFSGTAFFGITVENLIAYTADWDDGTPDNLVGDGTEQIIGHTYPVGGPYHPFITVPYASLLALDISGTPEDTIFGPLAPFPNLEQFTNLTSLKFSFQQLNGDIPDLTKFPGLTTFSVSENAAAGRLSFTSGSVFPNYSSLTSLATFRVNESLQDFAGSFPSNLPTSIVDFQLTGGGSTMPGKMTGSIPSLTGLTSLQYIDLTWQPSISGSFPSLPTTIKQFWIGCSSTNTGSLTGTIPDLSSLTALENLDLDYQTGITGYAGSALPASLKFIDLNSVGFNQTNVDNWLVYLDTAGTSNGSVDLRNTATPSSTGLTAKSNLEGKGWTVQVDP